MITDSIFNKNKHCLFVNSGSSANLVALSILSSPFIKNPIKPGDEIITPAITWSTTVFPIYNIGAIPVFIDCDPNSLTMLIEQIENSITPDGFEKSSIKHYKSSDLKILKKQEIKFLIKDNFSKIKDFY